MIERAFTEQLHPRGTGAVGGQFVTGGAAKKTAPAGSPARKASAKKTPSGGGSLSFDGKRGAGYGVKGGDKRVKTLQTALNRLGLTDSTGKKLAVDGKLGPRTTAAIKKAQRKLGLKPDGVVTPALLRQLAATKHSRDLKKAPAKPVKKAVPAKKAAPAYVKPAKPKPMATVHRSTGYSGGMDLTRHMAGKHNQQSHANRLGKPGNIAGKTGLSKATAALADKPELGPSLAPAHKISPRVGTNDVRLDDEVQVVRSGNGGSPSAHLGKKGRIIDMEGVRPTIELDDGKMIDVHKSELKVLRTGDDPSLEAELQDKLDAESAKARENMRKLREQAPAHRDFTAAEIRDILADEGKAAWTGVSRRNEDHLKRLEAAGATPEQAREILKDLRGNPDRPWETTDVGFAIHNRVEDEVRAKAAAARTEQLALATPAAFARLLGTDGQPALVKSKPVLKVFESMQANGWRMTDATGHGGYTFSSADGGKVVQVLAINGVKIYDSRHNGISGVKALAYIEGN